MPLRFPDQFPSLREVDGLSDTAYRLNMAALFWSNVNRTDGLIRLEDLALVNARLRAPERFAAECVRRGAWHDARHDCGSEHCLGPFDADGWAVHDYLRYAQSKAELEAGESGMSGGGKRGNHRRWHEQRGITSPGCEFCEAPVAPEARVEPPAPKRTSGTRSLPDSGAIPSDRSDQDLYQGEESQNPDQGQDQNRDRRIAFRRPADERNRAPRVVALTVKALWKKSGQQPVSDEQALHAIAVLEKRAAEAGTVIHDPVKYFPAAVRREADVHADLLPLAAEVLAEEPPAAEPQPGAHEYVHNPKDGRCLTCEMPKSNRSRHPRHIQAVSA